MSIMCCRICLAKKVQRNVSELQSIPEIDKNHQDIMLFCLDIEVSGDPLVSRSLCKKCYQKIISFYIFKLQAIKNDVYLRSQNTKEEVENTNKNNQTNDFIKVEDEIEIKIYYDDLQHDQCKLDVKEDLNELKLNVKAEDIQDPEKVESHNEVLSDSKAMKTYKNIQQNSTNEENHTAEEKIKTTSNSKIKRPQVCELCGKSFLCLREHMERHKNSSDRKKYPCKNCPKIFYTSDGMYKHNRQKHLMIRTKCTICDKYYTNLHQHTLTAHNKEKCKFSCVMCEKRFTSQSALDKHSQWHNDDRPYQCDECNGNYRTRTKTLLLTHIRAVHDKERPHMCHLCPRSFHKKTALHIHIRIHTNERPFSCDVCGKQFRRRCSLKQHHSIHTGVKSKECKLCTKKFSTQRGVSTHMATHSNEKPHPCQICELRFKRPDHRNVHERNIHGYDRRSTAPAPVVVGLECTSNSVAGKTVRETQMDTHE